MAYGNNCRADGLWSRVDALIDSAPTEGDLRSHRLEVLAARRLRSTGRVVPHAFKTQERLAAITAIAAPHALEAIAAVYPRPGVVLKGPEVAARYPAPGMRNYGDVDVLFEDAEEAHRTLVEAGFEPVGDPALYLEIHHLRPLRPPSMALLVEIHSRPKWLRGRRPPPTEELFAAAGPSTTGVDGMLALPGAHHALVLAAHSWAHEPLRRLRDVIDIAATVEGTDRDEIEDLSRAWGVGRLWRTTAAVVDALFAGGSRRAVLRVWAQNLGTARERTVFESHLERWLSDFWALPPTLAIRRLPGQMLADLRPDEGEGWRTKLDRTALALRHASHPRSDHELVLSGRLEAPEPDEEP